MNTNTSLLKGTRNPLRYSVVQIMIAILLPFIM